MGSNSPLPPHISPSDWAANTVAVAPTVSSPNQVGNVQALQQAHQAAQASAQAASTFFDTRRGVFEAFGPRETANTLREGLNLWGRNRETFANLIGHMRARGWNDMVIVDATRQLLREHGSNLFAAEGHIDPRNVTDVSALFQRLQQAGLGRNDAIRCLDQFVNRTTLTEAVTRADRFAQEAAQSAARLAQLQQNVAPAAQTAVAEAETTLVDGQTLRTVGQMAPRTGPVNDLGQAVRRGTGTAPALAEAWEENTSIESQAAQTARQAPRALDGVRQGARQAVDSLRQAGTQTIQTLRNNWQGVVAVTTGGVRAAQMAAAASGSTVAAGALGTLATGTVGLNLPTAAVAVGGLSVGAAVGYGVNQVLGSPVTVVRSIVNSVQTGQVQVENIGLSEHIADGVYWLLN